MSRLVRIGMAPRAHGLTAAAAQEHWRTAHRDAALGIPGLLAYVQNHAVLRDGRPLLGYPGFDVCAETEYDDLAAMRAAFASDHYRGAVRDDEAKLIDGSRFMLALTHRHVVADGDIPDGAVKLMTFLRAAPSARDGALLDVLAGDYARAAAAAGPLRHEQLITDAAAHDGDLAACCDAVDVLWFADADAALVAAEHRLDDAGWLLGGIAFGTARAIVCPLRMR
jgi:uncharacterized protein (TIGR02118 family)